jgi:hypothetical protein
MNPVQTNVATQFLTILLTVFILSCFWEFYLEESFLSETPGTENIESTPEKWEYVFTNVDSEKIDGVV